jgi:hypothetical protein
MATPARRLIHTILALTLDLASLASSAMRSRAQLAAENLFLRKQLALCLSVRSSPIAPMRPRIILGMHRYRPS